MFSYKLYQQVLCFLISFVFAQSLKPSFETIREKPMILSKIFKLTPVLHILMLVSFLYELSLYNQHERSQIFKTQLTKVFLTATSFYFVSIIISSWIQTISSYVQKQEKVNQKYRIQLEELKQEYAGRYETNIYKSKVKFLEKPLL